MSIFDAISTSNNHLLVKLLNEKIPLNSLNYESLTCFEFALKQLEKKKEHLIIGILIGHPWTKEQMLITLLQYRIDRIPPSQEMVYKYLLIGCKNNLPNLSLFILKNFNVQYSIFQDEYKCLDICEHNSCFQVFLSQRNTRFLVHIYKIDKYILPISNSFYDNPFRDYLYRIFYLACIHRSVDFINYVTQNFIISLEYNPYSKVSYFNLVQGTPLYQILFNYCFPSNTMTNQDIMEVSLLSQFQD